MNTLNDKQKQVYKDVINERLNIYLMGMFLGLALAFIINIIQKIKMFVFF